MNPCKLSVVIITFNEAKNIASCIASVTGLADEVLVVDSYSSDETLSIAEHSGAKILQHEFQGHIEQKNWAASQAKFDWVLSLDADEQLGEELFSSILAVKKNNFCLQSFTHKGYYFNRLNHLNGKPIKGCGWYPDKKLRLWNRLTGKWGGTNPHDKFILDKGHSSAHLTGDILHFTYPSATDLRIQSVRFGKIGGMQYQNRHVLMLLLQFLFSGMVRFVRNYILRRGWIYGIDGLQICFWQMVETQLKYSHALKNCFFAKEKSSPHLILLLLFLVFFSCVQHLYTPTLGPEKALSLSAYYPWSKIEISQPNLAFGDFWVLGQTKQNLHTLESLMSTSHNEPFYLGMEMRIATDTN